MKSIGMISLVILVCVASQLMLLCSILLVWPEKDAKVVFCDVGQGDATIIIDGFTQVLVDAGPENKRALACMSKHIPWFDSRLDLFIATHPDLDHIGGAGVVLDRFFVSHVMIVPDAKNTDGFHGFREVVLRKQAQGSFVSFPVLGQSGAITPCSDCSESGMRYDVMSPMPSRGGAELPNVYIADLPETTLSAYFEKHETSIKNYNDRSISVLLHIRGMSVFITGDIESNTERELASQRLLTPVTVLKVAHHGSKTSSTPVFLEKTLPEEAIISVGKDNRFNHPADEVITRVEETGSRIWRTDEHGEIVMTISGGTYRVEGEKSRKIY